MLNLKKKKTTAQYRQVILKVESAEVHMAVNHTHMRKHTAAGRLKVAHKTAAQCSSRDLVPTVVAGFRSCRFPSSAKPPIPSLPPGHAVIHYHTHTHMHRYHRGPTSAQGHSSKQ